ncbi:MAG: hypothetical protein GYA55_01115, partial [SAR324 cluster bacterium]|nr:hypothetical protein [SAR324 cluster bacterium]
MSNCNENHDSFRHSIEVKSKSPTIIQTIILFTFVSLLPFCFLAAEQKKEQNKFQMYNGKIIRSISIEIRDIFDETDSGSLYKTINGVKVNTREQVIRRELLIKEGEAFDNFKLYETERVLRALRFLRNIELSVSPDGDFVDIKVRVQDTWTLIPKLGYSTGDGKEKKFIGIAESDLLGYGKRAELGYAEEDNRRTVQTVWEDPRLWGTEQRLAAAYLQRNDGELSFFSLDRPFRSFLDTYSWGIEGNDVDTIGRLFENGDEYYIYRQRLLDLGFNYTLSSARNPEDEVSRYSFGWAINNARFYNATLKDYEDLSLNPAELLHDEALRPENRRFSGPTFLYEYVKPDFISSNYIDKFDRTEDYNLGIDFTTRLFFAPELTGSNNDSVLLTSNLAKGWRAGEGAFTRGEFGLSSRIERGLGLQNSLFRTEWNFFKVFSPSFYKESFIGRHTFASAFSLDYGWELDKDRQFLLGADTGLRGYDARTFDGDKRFLLNIEDRIYLV